MPRHAAAKARGLLGNKEDLKQNQILLNKICLLYSLYNIVMAAVSHCQENFIS